MDAWPSGSRDAERYGALEPELRERLEFLAGFFGGIIARRPVYAEALAGAANALTALGFFEDGLHIDRRLADLKPDDALVRYNLSCSLALTRRADEAFAELARAIDLGYRDARHLARDEDWAPLRADPRFSEQVKRLRKRR